MPAADCLSFLRLLLVPHIWLVALQGQSRLVGVALITLLTGAYEPLLLRLAIGALLFSSVESILIAITTIQAKESPATNAPRLPTRRTRWRAAPVRSRALPARRRRPRTTPDRRRARGRAEQPSNRPRRAPRRAGASP